jgi:nucleoside-diphosphate-sugar epimerase
MLKLRPRGNPYQISILDSVAAFYSSLRTDQALDGRIEGRLGRDVIEWCNKVIQAANIEPAVAPIPRPRSALTASPTVLVLGGAGFIGRELIRQLLAAGYCVRAMVRSSGAVLEELENSHLEIVRGDMRREADLKSAMQGIEFIYHLATSDAKTWDDTLRNEVEPTRLVGEVCLAAGVKRLVYTGTIASYYAGAKAGTITEETPLDRNIGRRIYYARAKAASEAILMEMHHTQRLPVVIFRPGIVIGRGGNPFHSGVGMFTENICEVCGDGNNKLPFVLVTDVASALLRGIEVEGIEGRSYNLIDMPLLTARDYLKELERRAGMTLTVYYRSIWRFYVSDLVKWVVKLAVRHPDRIRIPSYFDWESRTQKAFFDCRRARNELGWMPAADRQRLIEEGIGGSLEAWLAATR